MKSLFTLLVRLTVTGLAVAAAGLIAWRLWDYYMEEPWTRDGRVRADVVGVAPDVSGLVTEVRVRDNQVVKKGDVLFQIDRARFVLALQQADAAVANGRARLDEAGREHRRNSALSGLVVSEERMQQSDAALQAAQAALQQAQVEQAVARLNLERSAVVAPVNGVVTNFDLRPGDYVSTGRAVAALVDSDTFHVDGYFEETKLPRIHVGDKVSVHLMGEATALDGHVESIAAGIHDRERGLGSGLLPDVNPTFNWVRLAQRVPVRIALDRVPPQVRLVTGRTATVAVTGPASQEVSTAAR